MDGPFYVDTMRPHMGIPEPASITLSTTMQALLPIANLPNLGNKWFGYAGRAVRVRLSGRLTTGATPGNISYSFLYGSNANNVGTTLATVTIAGPTNQTATSWISEHVFRVRSIDPSITGIMVTGWWLIQGFGQVMMPASNPGATGVDLTAAQGYLSPQMQRSGSTGETVQVHDVLFEALN